MFFKCTLNPSLPLSEQQRSECNLEFFSNVIFQLKNNQFQVYSSLILVNCSLLSDMSTRYVWRFCADLDLFLLFRFQKRLVWHWIESVCCFSSTKTISLMVYCHDLRSNASGANNFRFGCHTQKVIFQFQLMKNNIAKNTRKQIHAVFEWIAQARIAWIRRIVKVVTVATDDVVRCSPSAVDEFVRKKKKKLRAGEKREKKSAIRSALCYIYF